MCVQSYSVNYVYNNIVKDETQPTEYSMFAQTSRIICNAQTFQSSIIVLSIVNKKKKPRVVYKTVHMFVFIFSLNTRRSVLRTSITSHCLRMLKRKKTS